MQDFHHPDRRQLVFGLKVWTGIFLYALLAGLAIQLVVLPYFFPQLHAGNGLVAGRDWVGFHAQAVQEAQNILQGGWDKFRFRPDGDNAIIGIAAAFYALFSPHPWTLLPLNAVMFATGGVALFSILRRIGLAENESFVALLPYLFFPSSLLQYAQIHKDVFCTASVLVVLWTWIVLLSRQRTFDQIIGLLLVNFAALVVMSVFRPYFMFPFLGMVGVLLVFCILRITWKLARGKGELRAVRVNELRFNLQSVLILLVLGACTYVMSVSYVDLQLRPIPADVAPARLVVPTFSWHSNENVRSADSSRVVTEEDARNVREIQECRLVVLREGEFVINTINRMFLKVAVARAGFTSSGGTTAASNIDKNQNFCKNADLIRYIPRALQIAFFAPFPSTWFSLEKRNSSAIEIYISAVEMFYCYIAYAGLLYWAFNYRRWNVALMLPVTFAFGLCLLLGLTVANVGTLYRMRFPFAMIFVSIGMAGILQVAKMRPPWVEAGDSVGDESTRNR
ncbi:MAG: hypothetical protein V4542_11190 [Pseudomonadota bacterium]